MKSLVIFFKRPNNQIILVAIIAFLIRSATINPGIWSDEIYSMLCVHPQNSLKTTLLLQINDQPPLYFVLLKIICDFFGYQTEVGIWFSVILSTASVYLLGRFNFLFFGKNTGIISAIIMGLSTTLVYHGTEIRFYPLILFLGVLVYGCFWSRLYGCVRNLYSVFNSMLFGLLCALFFLSHYFSLFILIPMFLIETRMFLLKKNKIGTRYIIAYLFALLFVLPWIYYFVKLSTVLNGYWNMEFDLINFITYFVSSNTLIGALVALLVFILLLRKGFNSFRKYWTLFFLFFVFVGCITIFSFVKYPITVPRYGTPMFPILITLISLIISKDIQKKLELNAIIVSFISILLIGDIIHYLSNHQRRAKEPWCEMAGALMLRDDCENIPLVSFGLMVNGRFTCQYYLPEKRILNFDYYKDSLGELDSFYMIQTNGHDKMNKVDSLKLSTLFDVETTHFGFSNYGKGGTIAKYRKIKMVN
jgi:uncharacterized membrane protein